MNLSDIIDLSPPVALALMLNLVGMAMKRSPIADWVIPWVMMGLGSLVYGMVASTADIGYDVRYPQLLNFIHGACIGGASVGLHQTVKQFIEQPAKPRRDDVYQEVGLRPSTTGRLIVPLSKLRVLRVFNDYQSQSVRRLLYNRDF